jgi:hypothetical protein
MKILKAVAFTLLVTVTASYGVAVTFSNGDTEDWVTGDTGPGAAQNGWAVSAFVGSYSPGDGSPYQTYYLQHGIGYYGGDYGLDTLSEGNQLVGVVFNQSSVPTGGDYWYSLLTSVGGYDSNPYTVTSDPNQVVQWGGDGTWVHVPEPGTYALFGLGLVTLALYRRKQRS